MREFAWILLVPGVLFSGLAAALGLGELTLKSKLEEPLDAEVRLTKVGNLDADDISVRIFAREDFAVDNPQRAQFLGSLQFRVKTEFDGTGRLFLRSSEPAREPFLNFLVEVRWPDGWQRREYTVLLDPSSPHNPKENLSLGVKTTPVDSDMDPVEVAREMGLLDRPKAAATPAPARSQDLPYRPRSAPARTRNPAPAPSRSSNMNSLEGLESAPSSARSVGLSSVPRPGGLYRVRRDDTLWSIASPMRISGVTVEQVMRDIQRLNPDAFYNNNPGRLREGYILHLPTGDADADMAYSEDDRYDDPPKSAARPSYMRPSNRLEAGSDYRVQRNDTLWNIAYRLRTSGYTVQQIMREIQRLNPGAFPNNDVSRLKTGQVLRLPNLGGNGSYIKEDNSETSRRSSGRALDDLGDDEEEEEKEDTSSCKIDLEQVKWENTDQQARLVELEKQVNALKQQVVAKDKQIVALSKSSKRSSDKGTNNWLDLAPPDMVVENWQNIILTQGGLLLIFLWMLSRRRRRRAYARPRYMNDNLDNDG